MTSQKSLISSFYQDKSIFITGATGFVGKVLVEKLLRSCPDIKTIYLLLRSKKGSDAKQRLEDLLNAKVFERVKNEHPNAISKLAVINGDLTRTELGISASDIDLLVNNVSVVFHSAATVKFDEPLKKAVTMNALGTRRLIELCHRMKNLEAMIYVSTAYCNCDLAVVEEAVYRLPHSSGKLIDTIEWMDEDLVEVLAPHLMRGRPNTYLYTKALAENLLLEASGALPVAIIRPSVVTAAWKEPFPGWIDNCYGTTGCFVFTGKGILRSMHCNSSYAANLIPVDIVINLMICVAWHTATFRQKEIKVYNCTSGSMNKVTWKSVETYLNLYCRQYPSDKIFRYPKGRFETSKLRNYLSVILDHYVPAYLLDFVSVIKGKRPKLVPLLIKIRQALKYLEYFTVRQWTFNTDNVLKLQNCLSVEDKKDFDFNIESLEWPAYIEDYVLGVRQFVLKEEASSLPSARKNLRRMYLYSKLGQFVIALIVVWIIRIRLARNISKINMFCFS